MGILPIIKWGLLPKAVLGKSVEHGRTVIRLTELRVNGLREVDTCEPIRSMIAST